MTSISRIYPECRIAAEKARFPHLALFFVCLLYSSDNSDIAVQKQKVPTPGLLGASSQEGLVIAMNIQLMDIWTAAGVLLGFQATAFSFRVQREVDVSEKRDDLTWLPPADMVNLFSMLVLVIGVFVLPILGFVGQNFIKYSFGLAVLLFLGYPFALAGHYEMYNNASTRSRDYFPREEKVIVAIICVLAIAYVVVAIIEK